MIYPNKVETGFTNCDKEPVHIIGKIQPHGVLMVLDKASLIVEQVTENINTIFNKDFDEVLGKDLHSLFINEEQGLQIILEQISDLGAGIPGNIIINRISFFSFIHQSSEKLVLELEPYSGSSNDLLQFNKLIVNLTQELNKLDTLSALADLVTDFFHSFLNYDRTLLFKFDEEWHSEVISERAKSGIQSFAGHHFPATDIPLPARNLIAKKHIRQIPDVSAKSSKISPYLNPSTGAPTDISLSELRNPSEIHLEYLKNMGVGASISFSIIVNDKLWGILSCHNVTPIFIDYYKRQSCDLVIKIFSNAVSSVTEKVNHLTLKRYQQNEEKLIAQINKSDIINGLFKEKLSVLDISECDGAAICLDNQIITIGVTPEKDTIKEMVKWFASTNNHKLFYSRSLSENLKGIKSFRENINGVLALEISRFEDECLLFFKNEFKEIKTWAGNPNKAVEQENLRLSPRKSFEKWEEEIKGKSLPWSLAEIEVARILIKDIISIRLRDRASKLEELNKSLKNALDNLGLRNSQLQDFAYIITHNLRSPILNFNSLYSIYMEDPALESNRWALESMKLICENLLSTIDDLFVVLKSAAGTKQAPENINLKDIVQKEIQNLDAVIKESDAEIKIDFQVYEITMLKPYLESMVHNLLSNALKYRSPDRKPYIEIKSWVDDGHLFLSFYDNGLGMNLNKIGDKLFGLFRTFHNAKDAKGLGLYLTRQQIQSMGGEIHVESEPDKGSIFTVKLPQNV